MGRSIGIALVALASLLVATGCDKTSGGGWIPSLVPGEKATFGFSARCKDTRVNGSPIAVLYDGQFEYEDRAAGVRIHGDVEPVDFVQIDATCRELGEAFHEPEPIPFSLLQGTYRTQPDGTRPDGTFSVLIEDGGEPGTINGDFLCVTLEGVHTYSNCENVQGGNIQVH